MNAIDMPANAPQPITWWLANYYPTNADGQTATVIGTLFKTYEDAVSYARTYLATAGVGVVYVQKVEGFVVFPLYEPVPN